VLLAVGVRPALAAGGTGKIAGTVKFAGPVPMRSPLAPYEHEEVCGKGVPDERLVVGPRGGVRFAVVTVEGVKGGKAPERDATVTLDNHSCRFEPHVQTAEVGQWVELRNGDPLLHNADARIGADTVFNVGLPPGRQTRRPLARTGLMKVACDIHKWMTAYIAVTDHPYHTVTDAYGAYEIRDLPAGTYTVRVWHEELGTLDHSTEVVADQTATADFSYSTPAEGKGETR
jgi:plastocyanin